MRLCSIEGCGRKHYQHDYCFMHFGRIVRGCTDMRPGKIVDMPKRLFRGCNVDGCNEKHFAKGYCRNHHASFLRNGTPYKKYLDSICKVPGCDKPRSTLGYCDFHYARFKKGIPLDADRYETHRGANNEHWKGGIAEYPNHSLLKRVRKMVLEERGSVCQICHAEANYVHHLDKSKDNHEPENLIVICQKCHLKFFHNGTHKSKFRKLYGMNLPEIAEHLHCSIAKVRSLHEHRLLKIFIDDSSSKLPDALAIPNCQERKLVSQETHESGW